MQLKKRLVLFMCSLIIFSLGISQAVQVKYLGIHPWEVLHVGLYERIGLSIGSWSIIIGLFLIAITLIMDRRYIHVGTFINIFFVGWFVDLFLWLDILPKASNLYFDICLILLSMILMGIGGGINNACKLGSGPRDGFMLAISDKTKISIRSVRIILETSIMIIGIIIGGPVFIFTFIYTFVQSPIFQYAYLKTVQFISVSNMEKSA